MESVRDEPGGPVESQALLREARESKEVGEVAVEAIISLPFLPSGGQQGLMSREMQASSSKQRHGQILL